MGAANRSGPLTFEKTGWLHPGNRILSDLAEYRLNACSDIEGLAGILARLDTWVRDMSHENVLGPVGSHPFESHSCQSAESILSEVFSTVSKVNEMVTSHLIQHWVHVLEHRDGRSPPLPFCWITLGSDARGEQLIRTDQDNALIYADPSPGSASEAADYFAALAKEVNRALNALGFTFCPGKVMASNPRWCRSLSGWLGALDDWVGSSDPMAVRNLTILLDFKAVFGDRRLAAMLHSKVFASFEAHPAASHFLVRDDQLFAPPKGMFNRIRTKKEAGCRACFNLKTQALAHIVNGARLFAVTHRMRVPSTAKRLEYLAGEGSLSSQEHQRIGWAFFFLSWLKIRQHFHGNAEGPKLPPNCIDIACLDPETKKILHHALDAVTAFQKKMAVTYNQNWMNFFN